MPRAYRYRFYPTPEEAILLSKIFGCCRFVFNLFLDEKQKSYKEAQKTLSYGDCAARLSVVTSDGKKENPPRALQRQLKRLKRRQRSLSRKTFMVQTK